MNDNLLMNRLYKNIYKSRRTIENRVKNRTSKTRRVRLEPVLFRGASNELISFCLESQVATITCTDGVIMYVIITRVD